MNFIVVIVCRKYDSSQDFETEEKEFTNNENKTIKSLKQKDLAI